MSAFSLLERTKFKFKITGAPYELGVVNVEVDEFISYPFEANLTLASEDDITFDDVVGKDALLTIDGDKANRYVSGIINRFARIGKNGRFIMYEANVVPRMWLLSQRKDTRTFQNKSIKEIITEVFKGAKIPADRLGFRLQEKYKPYEFLVQYNETDLHFIHRICEKEGIWYFFEHTEEKNVVVFADGPSASKPADGAKELPYIESGGEVPLNEAVFGLNLQKVISPGKYVTTDFDYNKPSQSLKSENEQSESSTDLEVYEYPAQTADPDDSARLAKVRLQEQTAQQETIHGQSTSPSLAPGFTFTLDGFEKRESNIEYLVISVSHGGAQPQALEEKATSGSQSYSNSFYAIPAKTPFKPPRKTKKPMIKGPQTAVVVGPSGEEIYTDDLGRVKVKFHWDRSDAKNETSSCWIRVAQLWAGEGWGSMFIPRIGQEVIVSFLDGDPDRPIITGRVFNGANPTPHPLPGSKTKSTIMSKSSAGNNELSFEDADGGEQIYIHAQKDMERVVENDDTTKVMNDRSKTVAGNETNMIAKNLSTTVGSGESHSVGGSQSINVGGAKTETVALASAETVGAAKALSIGGAYQISVGAASNESVGGVKSEQVGALKSVIVAKSMSEKVGGDRDMTTTKTHKINAKEIAITAMDSITIKVGKAIIKLSKNGDVSMTGGSLTIKGKKMKLDSSGNLVIKGKKIKEN